MIKMNDVTELEKLTKDELIDKYKELLEEYEDISQQLEDAEEYADEQEDSLNEYEGQLEELKENAILDVDDFKRKLDNQNLMNRELEEFIENYLRFENKVN